MNFSKFIFALFVITIFIPYSLTSCSVFEKIEEAVYEPKQFGEFDSYGYVLTQRAVKNITSDEAKQIILENASSNSQSLDGIIIDDFNNNLPLPSSQFVSSFTAKYADCTASTYYYIDGVQEVKNDFLQGTDLKAIIENNTFTPFNQLVAKLIVVFPEIIDYMDAQNEAFKTSDTYDVAPFKTLFSYHKDKKGNLVIQCRDFAEIPSSEAGGVACSYRQDTEIVFDATNKISYWQTSLGVYTASVRYTKKQGYILAVEFNWKEKS